MTDFLPAGRKRDGIDGIGNNILPMRCFARNTKDSLAAIETSIIAAIGGAMFVGIRQRGFAMPSSSQPVELTNAAIPVDLALHIISHLLGHIRCRDQICQGAST